MFPTLQARRSKAQQSTRRRACSTPPLSKNWSKALDLTYHTTSALLPWMATVNFASATLLANTHRCPNHEVRVFFLSPLPLRADASILPRLPKPRRPSKDTVKRHPKGALTASTCCSGPERAGRCCTPRCPAAPPGGPSPRGTFAGTWPRGRARAFPPPVSRGMG